jgi:hypothetical protein
MEPCLAEKINKPVILGPPGPVSGLVWLVRHNAFCLKRPSHFERGANCGQLTTIVGGVTADEKGNPVKRASERAGLAYPLSEVLLSVAARRNSSWKRSTSKSGSGPLPYL